MINSWISLCIILLILGFVVMLLVAINKKCCQEKGVENTLEENNEQNLEESISGAESAAIAMALHLYYADGDGENTLTIKHIANRYSPWNSKIYGLQ